MSLDLEAIRNRPCVEDVPYLLDEIHRLRRSVADLTKTGDEALDELDRVRTEIEQLDARANAAEQERDDLRARFADVRELHTDSPAGVCPSCYRLGDVSDTDDGLVDWPCPTLRAIGVGPS